jgi:hypothetical protein
MVQACYLDVEVEGYNFHLQIYSSYFELYADMVFESRSSCIYIGPDPTKLNPALQKQIEDEGIATLARKGKTAVRIETRCNSDVLEAMNEEGPRQREAELYLIALCGAHIPVLNKLVQSYRLATYDYFPYEVSPWDVPVWFLETDLGFRTVVMLPYARWDFKPTVNGEVYRLIEPAELPGSVNLDPTPGELEVLDALNLMERGDFSGAVRRITTSIEVIVEAKLREELEKLYPQTEVDTRLDKSKNDVPGRIRQLGKLSGRLLDAHLQSELDRTRSLRHKIVHDGYRVPYTDRGSAQRSVDTGRWIFNFFEDDPDRVKVRETRIALRSLGRSVTASIFHSEITQQGVVVHAPH